MSGGAEVTIWHNPACGTSRNVLAMIREAGIEPHVVLYLKETPSKAEITAVAKAAGVPLRALVRDKGTPFEELGLGDPKVTDAQLLDAMMAHPILINRPIVITAMGAALCRPKEKVLDLLGAGGAAADAAPAKPAAKTKAPAKAAAPTAKPAPAKPASAKPASAKPASAKSVASRAAPAKPASPKVEPAPAKAKAGAAKPAAGKTAPAKAPAEAPLPAKSASPKVTAAKDAAAKAPPAKTAPPAKPKAASKPKAG